MNYAPWTILLAALAAMAAGVSLLFVGAAVESVRFTGLLIVAGGVALLLLIRLREQTSQARVELREQGLVLCGLSPPLLRYRIIARYTDLDTIEIIPFAGRWRLILWLADGRRFHLSVAGREDVSRSRRILRERLRLEQQPGYGIQQVHRRLGS